MGWLSAGVVAGIGLGMLTDTTAPPPPATAKLPTVIQASSEQPMDWVRSTLRRAAKSRGTSEQHLLITFRTKACGVRISQKTREAYPEGITIVLQHQYERLVVERDRFSVAVSFSGRWERIQVPFSAMTAFYDVQAPRDAKFDVTPRGC